MLNLEKTLNTWQRRNLTLYRKINIIKTLGISKLIYSSSVLPVPDHYIQEINKLIFNFIWQGTRLKTKETPELENWKAYLKSPIQNVKYHTTVNPLTTSSIYSSLLKTIFVRPTAENNILRHGFKESTIQKVYLMPFSVTNEVKIMFQFKVIPNVLPTRATLYPDGISESPICNLCNAWFHLDSERGVLHVRRLCSIRLPNFLVSKDGRNNVAFCTGKIRFRTPVKQVVF